IPKNYSRTNGYPYVHTVRRDAKPPGQFALDYDATDRRGRIAKGKDPHLRLTCLTPTNEVALAKGDPPQNKRGNPKYLDYAILTRNGNNLESVFTTVAEPYDTNPIVRSARRLEVEIGEEGVLAAAMEVKLTNGRTDTIIAAEKPARVVTETGVLLNGTFGILSHRGGKIVFAKLTQGTELSYSDFSLKSPVAEIRGEVIECNIEDPADNHVIASLERKPARSMKDRIVVFQNDGVQDAAYNIQSIRKQGKNFKISFGEETLIRGYADPKDPAKGFVLNVNAAEKLSIPMSVVFESD
ncbi:MAG: hypothetical protein QF886_21055, partial [Planctomycetota bacterium]|nr:hypothetical protein [Planctomycetota bacterium]